jgi:SET domain-containing protein
MFDRYAYLNPKLHVVAHPEKGGGGVFAREFVEAGERLMVWGGAVVNRKQLDQLPAVLRSHSVQVEEDLYLASVIPDDPADFINHSCDPNAGLNGQIVIVAMRDIEPGEEVCFDYAMSDSSPYDEFDCQCGAAICRGRVTGQDWMRPDLQTRYRGFFSPYLQKRIAQLQPDAPAHNY